MQVYRRQDTMTKIITTIAVALALTGSAMAADFYRTDSGVWIDGEIVRGDADHFASFTAQYPAGTYIVLASPGGNMGEMFLIGDTIQTRGFNTMVSRRAACGSACAFLFFSGHHAVVQQDSKLCFHMPYDMRTGAPMTAEQINAFTDAMSGWG